MHPNVGPGGQIIAILSIILALGISTHVVFIGGGTQFVWPYLMMMPIALAGMIFNMPGGILVGLIAALLLGPYMPLDVARGLPQTTENWIIRCAFYVSIGTFVGIVAALLNAENKRVKGLAEIDESTGLQYASKFSIHAAPYKKVPEKYIVCVISIRNYSDIQAVFGFMTAKASAIQVFTNFQERLLDDTATVLHISSTAIGVVRPGSLLEGADFLSALAKAIPRYIRINNVRLPVRPAIGVAEVESNDLNQQAPFDKALFACEKAATEIHGVATFDAADLLQRQSNLSLMDDLYKDLDQGGCLSMHYQPKQSLQDNMIYSAEALIRWNSPKHGYVPPDRFIPLAEKSGLISGVTKWVLSQTVQELEHWRKVGIPIDMSVNLAADDLVDEEILDILHSLPKRLGSAFNGLELELTETGLVKDFEATSRALEDLRAIGYKIAIDDFGTGYSSLQQFKRIDVNTIKIDQCFITDLLESEESQGIVSASIAMCRSRNIQTVAEGAEDEKVVTLLRDLGCDFVQGYAIAKPMPADEFRAWLFTQSFPGSKKLG
jgi:EAL domain-containing protein (putative c-di-GMP-specific phosphodiesterase class I)|tara:strand:+ start:1648 stop:3294 length:1647 start_codon:yes stop_codon:yes gene_type:complete